MTVLDYRGNAIVDLMQVDDEDCGEPWLLKALQAALMVELATIPPYACGLWSIKEPKNSRVHIDIQEIIFDEMSHFGRVGNILTAIGGQPVLAERKGVPRYPGPLPGGVRPELTVFLSGLSKRSLGMFAKIEEPQDPIVTMAAGKETYTSIGAFYAKVRRSLEANRDLFRRPPGPQVLFPGLAVHGKENVLESITGWEQADHAIEAIMQQGEGRLDSPLNPFYGAEGELAHYYTFLEIEKGRKLTKVGDKWGFYDDAEEIPMPSAYPMAEVPEGGWAKDSQNAPTGPVKAMMEAFNAHYSVLLRSLEEAWRKPEEGKREGLVMKAVASMSSMRALARVIMQMPLPADDGKTYGPEFQYTEQEP